MVEIIQYAAIPDIFLLIGNKHLNFLHFISVLNNTPFSGYTSFDPFNIMIASKRSKMNKIDMNIHVRILRGYVFNSFG